MFLWDESCNSLSRYCLLQNVTEIDSYSSQVWWYLDAFYGCPGQIFLFHQPADMDAVIIHLGQEEFKSMVDSSMRSLESQSSHMFNQNKQFQIDRPKLPHSETLAYSRRFQLRLIWSVLCISISRWLHGHRMEGTFAVRSSYSRQESKVNSSSQVSSIVQCMHRHLPKSVPCLLRSHWNDWTNLFAFAGIDNIDNTNPLLYLSYGKERKHCQMVRGMLLQGLPARRISGCLIFFCANVAHVQYKNRILNRFCSSYCMLLYCSCSAQLIAYSGTHSAAAPRWVVSLSWTGWRRFCSWACSWNVAFVRNDGLYWHHVVPWLFSVYFSMIRHVFF